jgi:hypothetical protein
MLAEVSKPKVDKVAENKKKIDLLMKDMFAKKTVIFGNKVENK